LCSAVAGHPDCHPIVVIRSPLYDCSAAIVVNTIVAILLLVIDIASSLSSASHCAVASRLSSCPSSASCPPTGCCIASWRLHFSLRCHLLSCPSCASHSADCRITSPHAATSHCPHCHLCCCCHHWRLQRVFAAISVVCIIIVIICCHCLADCYVR
jgi:hypothetical protein